MFTYSFWKDLGERIIRQELQTALPVVLAIAASGSGVSYSALALTMATILVLTALKAVAGVAAPEGSSTAVVLLDRVGSAVAVTVLGFLPEETLSSTSGWLSIHWGAVGVAAAGSAVASLIQYYLNPPVFSAGAVATARAGLAGRRHRAGDDVVA